ncbi:MAG: LicD family protein [Lachnospiraceae bacterium]|nr:LicD family protein [Lachnospiraceae bacterium]
MKRPDIIIPVYKADKKLEQLLTMLLRQTLRPAKVVLMNTEAEGFTVQDLKKRVEKVAGKNDDENLTPVEIKLVKVEKKEFDHGGTRNLAIKTYSTAELVLCMTQDAVPANEFLLENLVRCFEDDSVGAAYARQMAAANATFTETYLRLHNYPAETVKKTKQDMNRLGIKTYMISNACAMYRRSRYEELGGFVTNTIFNEDMIFGASLIEAGDAIVYCAEAKVYHTHNYGLKAQFKRSFDLAVSQAEYPQVFRKVSSEKEGVRYVWGALSVCAAQKRFGDAFLFFADAVARYAGFFVGKHYRSLPERVILKCTLQPAYWEKKKMLLKSENVIEEGKTKGETGGSSGDPRETSSVLKELHEIELGALKAFVKLCNTYGLRYYAIGGTLLGAVRHKGFIPWDDDVDVAMPRKDYDRLIELVISGEAKTALGDEYRIESWQTDDTFKSYFAKICGTKIELQEALLEERTTRKGYLIDIIPLDGTPDGETERKVYYAKAMWLRFLCGTANVHTGIRTSRSKWEQTVLRIVRALRLYKVLKIKNIYKRMDRLFHEQDAETAEYAGTLTGAYKTREIVPRVYFGDTYDEYSLWEFEGMLLRGPKLWEEYLIHMFGDYRKLPPEEDRKVHYKPYIKRLTGEDAQR